MVNQPLVLLACLLGEQIQYFLRAKTGERYRPDGQYPVPAPTLPDIWHKSASKGFGEKQLKIKYPRILSSVGKSPEQYPDCEEDEEELG